MAIVEVVVRVRGGDTRMIPAEQLVPGDVILEVNRTPVRKPEEVVARVKATPPGGPVLFKIRREGKPRFVADRTSPSPRFSMPRPDGPQASTWMVVPREATSGRARPGPTSYRSRAR